MKIALRNTTPWQEDKNSAYTTAGTETTAHRSKSCFKGARFRRSEDRDATIQYLYEKDIPQSAIRFFRETLKHRPDFKPQPRKPGREEIGRLISSQQLEGPGRRTAVIDAIRDLLIQYLLPKGISVPRSTRKVRRKVPF